MGKTLDKELLRELARQNINPDDVEIEEDFNDAHPSTQIYKDKSGKRFAVISTPQFANHKKIDPRWFGKYISGNNLFKAKVTGIAATVNIHFKAATWSPQVFLNGKEVFCGDATLLPIDPINEK